MQTVEQELVQTRFALSTSVSQLQEQLEQERKRVAEQDRQFQQLQAQHQKAGTQHATVLQRLQQKSKHQKRHVQCLQEQLAGNEAEMVQLLEANEAVQRTNGAILTEAD